MHSWTRVLCSLILLLLAQSAFGQQESSPEPTAAQPTQSPSQAVAKDAKPEVAGAPATEAERLADLERRFALALDRIAALEAQLAAVPGTAAPDSAAAVATTTEAVAPAEVPLPIDVPPPSPPPVTIVSGAGGKNFLNLSLDGLFAVGTSTASDIGSLQPGGHDPVQRGFTVQNVETVFSGAVDPYFTGQANVVMQIDAEGETVVELEEVYATSTSLPAGLQLKAGQFFTEFGRLNPSHPHSWDFVDQPLVHATFLGPGGLRSAGARLSWLIPADFYSEASVSVQNAHGETLSSFGSVPGETLFGRDIESSKVASFSDLLIVPRYATSFDLSDTETLLLGASAAFGPNGTGPGGDTRIYGIDGFYKWKAANAFQGFPFLKIQGELMSRSVDVDASADGTLPRATYDDWGGYLQASWGYKPGHVAGLRFERVGGDQGDPLDPELAPRWRLSPALTWFPTEYSKLRLQYNYDASNDYRGDEHSIWLQFEFLLGAHAAHKF